MNTWSLDLMLWLIQRLTKVVGIGIVTIDNIKSEIQCLRDDIDVEFQRWYDEAKQLA